VTGYCTLCVDGLLESAFGKNATEELFKLAKGGEPKPEKAG